MKVDERNQKFFKIPLFLFPWQLWQSLSYQFRFFWLISFHYMWMWKETLLQNFVKFGVNLTFFAPWLPFWIFSTPKCYHTLRWIFLQSHEVWWKEYKIFFNPPFFLSMATAVKFVQPIPIFLAHLVPLDVDAVPIKFHQFLFVPTMFHERIQFFF
jgi:hypothetical protein